MEIVREFETKIMNEPPTGNARTPLWVMPEEHALMLAHLAIERPDEPIFIQRAITEVSKVLQGPSACSKDPRYSALPSIYDVLVKLKQDLTESRAGDNQKRIKFENNNLK